MLIMPVQYRKGFWSASDIVARNALCGSKSRKHNASSTLPAKLRILLASGSVAAIDFESLCHSFSECAEVKAVATSSFLHCLDKSALPSQVTWLFTQMRRNGFVGRRLEIACCILNYINGQMPRLLHHSLQVPLPRYTSSFWILWKPPLNLALGCWNTS